MFRAGDGGLLALGVAHEDHFWRALCTAVGLDEEAGLRSPQRLADRERLSALLADRLAARPRGEWACLLADAGVPYGEVHDLPDLAADPHVAARRLLTRISVPDGPARSFVRQPLVIDGASGGRARARRVLASTPPRSSPRRA